MRAVRFIAAAAALVTSIVLARVVLHGLTAHGHVDVFHAVVATVAAVGGLVLLRRAIVGYSRPA